MNAFDTFISERDERIDAEAADLDAADGVVAAFDGIWAAAEAEAAGDE